MTWQDQIEVCTNAADVSAAWKYLKLYEKELQNSLQARCTDCETFSTATHVSDEKRKGWLLLVTVMIEIAKWPQTISK